MTEHSHGKDVLQQMAEVSADLRAAIPEVYAGFGSLHKAAFAEGALDLKAKELIAFAIGVADQCDGCIASHGRSAARAGATRAEAAEAIGVTFLMAGGPVTI